MSFFSLLSLSEICLNYLSSSLTLTISFLTLTFSEWYSDSWACSPLISCSLSSITCLLIFLSDSRILLTLFSTAFSLASLFSYNSNCNWVFDSIIIWSLSWSTAISSFACWSLFSLSMSNLSLSSMCKDYSWSSSSLERVSQSCLASLSWRRRVMRSPRKSSLRVVSFWHSYWTWKYCFLYLSRSF